MIRRAVFCRFIGVGVKIIDFKPWWETLAAALCGLVVGVVGAYGVCLISGVEEWLYRWQTLLAGVLAFIASFLLFCSTVWSERKKRAGKALVSRVFSSHSMSSIYDYLIDSFKFYNQYIYGDFATGKFDLEKLVPPPSLMQSWFFDVRNLIEYEDARVVHVLSVLIVDLQVVEAKMKSLFDEKDQQNICEHYRQLALFSEMVRLVFLLEVVGRFFDYSRGLSNYDFSQVTYNQLSGGFVLCGDYFGDTRFPGVEELARELADSQKPITTRYF